MNLFNIFNFQNNLNQSSSDLVPWFELITDGLIINHNGSLLAGFEYIGLDIESSTSEEHKLASEYFEKSLSIFDNKYMFWSYLTKRKIKHDQINMIDNKVANFLQFEWNKVLLNRDFFEINNSIYISYQPFDGDGRFLDEIKTFFQTKKQKNLEAFFEFFKNRIFFKGKFSKYEETLDLHVYEFEKKLSTFSKNLEILGIKRLKNDHFLSEISNKINLATPRNKISLPKIGNIFLNTLLTVDSIFRLNNGTLKFIGPLCEKLLMIISIKGYPGVVNSDDLEKILLINGSFTLVQKLSIFK
jgi:type IV secretion system protein VirB4